MNYKVLRSVSHPMLSVFVASFYIHLLLHSVNAIPWSRGTTTSSSDVSAPHHHDVSSRNPSLKRSSHVYASQTQLVPVIHSFESVLQHNNVIDATKLLEACETFCGVLKKTGPKAVERDFANNLSKAKRLHQKTKSNDHQKITLGCMLTTERNLGIHQNSHLQDDSGAMGLLWMRRALAFQKSMYYKLLQEMETTSSSSDKRHHDYIPKRAALYAYQKELQPHHGWALRRFYTTFLKTKMPKNHVDMLTKVGGYQVSSKNGKNNDQEQTIHDLRRLVQVWEPLLKAWKQTFVQHNMEDPRRA